MREVWTTRLSAIGLTVLAGLTASCGSDSTGPSVEALPTTWIQVTSGMLHSCAIGDDGRAFCWGSNGFGQLGDSASGGEPRLVIGGHRWKQLAAGGNFTCGIRTDDHTLCWGMVPGSPDRGPAPRLVMNDPGMDRLVAGTTHVCGIAKSGKAYCWGDNFRGELGIGNVSPATPTEIVGGHGFVALAPGAQQTCGVSSDGAVYCWGGDAVTISVPQLVFTQPALSTITVGGVFSRLHGCGETSTDIVCWGYNQSGQTGHGTVSTGNPSFFDAVGPVTAPGGVRLHGVAASSGSDEILMGTGAHTCALTASGAAYCWGDNNYGQLGDGTRELRSVPVAVSGGLALRALSLGALHSCGLATDGQIYCWGNTRYGQLGTEPPAGPLFSAVPVPVFPRN